MILYPNCSYFHEEADKKDAPVDCEHCHRYDICKQSLDTGNISRPMLLIKDGKPTEEFLEATKDHFLRHTEKIEFSYLNPDGTKAQADQFDKNMQEFNDQLKREGKRIVKVLATVLICDEDKLR